MLRARFADARHFWDLDRKTRLESRVPALDKVTFQAKLGTQGERVRRLTALAATIAPLVGADAALAARAAELAKADLVSGMVGEFPELQGVMGRYYALHDGEPAEVADAIRDHYAPRGPARTGPIRAGFDRRRAGRQAGPIDRLLRHRGKTHRIRRSLCAAPGGSGRDPDHPGEPPAPASARPAVSRQQRCRDTVEAVFGFIIERLVVQLRADGARYDVLNAVFGAKGLDSAKADDLVALLTLTDAVAALLQTPDGANLLTAYRRAANILRIEERKDGPYDTLPSADLFREAAEIDLDHALSASGDVIFLLKEEAYGQAMSNMSRLRAPLDAFFEQVTVNAPDPALRGNRLRVLARVRSIMDQIADFSRIEG